MNTIVSTASLAGAAAVTASSLANANSPAISGELMTGNHPDRVLIDLGRELQDYLIESEPVRIALIKACDESEEMNAKVREVLNADDQGQEATSRFEARMETKYNLHENIRRWRSSNDHRNSLMDRALDTSATTHDGVMVRIRFRKWFTEYDPYLDAGEAVDEINGAICDDLEAIAARH